MFSYGGVSSLFAVGEVTGAGSGVKRNIVDCLQKSLLHVTLHTLIPFCPLGNHRYKKKPT